MGEYLYLRRGAEMLARPGEEVDNPGGWALLHRAGVRLEREAMRVLTAGGGGGDGDRGEDEDTERTKENDGVMDRAEDETGAQK